MYYFVGILIFIAIQYVFVSTNISEPLNDLIEAYKIVEIENQADVLKIIQEENIVNVLEQENFYILTSELGQYYKVPITETTMLGLELQGKLTEKIEESDNSMLNLLMGIVIAIMIVCIVKIIIDSYQEQKLMREVGNTLFNSNLESSSSEKNGLDKEKKKGKSDEDDVERKKVTFDDVQGIEELKPDLYRLVDCLKNPDKYEKIGARMPKGVILYGPPGTGKTLIARAIAGEADVNFMSACGSDFVEKYVGVGAARIRDLYKKAKKSAPCIVFIDEIDAVASQRGSDNNTEKDQTINALLAELDGFRSSDSVLTICATNRLDMLDSAFVRAGRFDLKLAVGLPDKDGRKAILKLHAKNKMLDESVDIDELSKKTIGFSGADLENLLNEGALIAANLGKRFIDNEDIENAFFKIIMEGNKKPRKEVNEETYLTAWHEAGHTLATKLLTNDGVPTVTIIQSTSGAGGVTFMTPDENHLPSKKYLRNQIKVSYAGRAAEEIYLGNSDEITTGASQDIKQATSIIKSYIGAYGMGNKGLIDIKQLTNQYDIVEEATELSNSLYNEVLEFLQTNVEKLRSLAERLIEKETLYEEEIDEILGIEKEEKENKESSENNEIENNLDGDQELNAVTI